MVCSLFRTPLELAFTDQTSLEPVFDSGEFEERAQKVVRKSNSSNNNSNNSLNTMLNEPKPSKDKITNRIDNNERCILWLNKLCDFIDWYGNIKVYLFYL